ncbi:hypothetical protein KY389_03850 [Paracoccus bogoriensis]|uniref:hypothetical protein n=1 Tax=Paracoccus bogoriensis TaxID=242065 RepID=UPI001CA49357|nr:hypothetical protein [Paracoccus bogoriensis]MBW7055828.1 hypothetical protein [Paracoccus bogoriensis]
MNGLLPPLFLAALPALAVGAGVLVVLGGETFPIGPTRLPMVYLVTPLAVLAVFQIVFGGLTGRWRGWRFWALALPVSAILWGTGLILFLDGRAAPVPLLLAEAAAHLLVAALALEALERMRRP